MGEPQVGAIRVTQAVLPQMRQRQTGRLLFVSSTSGLTVQPGLAAYAATKATLEAFAETLAIEVAGFGIDITLAEPGPVSSGVLDDMLSCRLPDDLPARPEITQHAVGSRHHPSLPRPQAVIGVVLPPGVRSATGKS